VYSSGVVRVKYPVKNGTKTAYAAMSGFFSNNDFSTATMRIGSRKTAYRKSTGSSTIGSVYADDDVIIIGHENGRTELIYPTGSSGFKHGYVAGTYNIAKQSSWGITSEQAKRVMFQAKYYADTYSDLKNAFGYNESQLYNHYITYGIKEGRSASPIFDPKFYLSNNSDLKKAYGNDYVKAYNHWINWGCKEGRYSSKFYNGSYYRNRYSDLQRAFFASGSADGYYDLACHYLNYGISERRSANSKGLLPSYSTNVINNESTASKIVSYELSQVGVGDYRGNNDVIYNTWYWGRRINGSGYAWCMAFQAYCCNYVTGSNNVIPKLAGCPSAVSWYKNRGLFQYSNYYGGNYTPKAGDLVFYTENGGRGVCHVGMIIGSPVNGYLQTVEGNIKCSDGNWKVVKFTNNSKRKINNSYVLGYATPAY
jgi:hypothetical protein